MPDQHEAYANCRFYVQIDKVSQAVFTEVSGLQVEMDVYEHEEGGNNGFVHHLPGRSKVGRLTLKRGMTKSNELFQWCLAVARGTIERRNLSVILYDTQGKELLRWDFVNAYPVKWSGPQFAADGSSAAVETLEIAHEGLRAG
jgi:phage tail-like protein